MAVLWYCVPCTPTRISSDTLDYELACACSALLCAVCHVMYGRKLAWGRFFEGLAVLCDAPTFGSIEVERLRRRRCRGAAS